MAVVSGSVRTIYVGGQDAITADNEVVGQGDIGAQTTQILANIETALAGAGAGLEHVIKWNVFIVEGQPVGPAYAAFQRPGRSVHAAAVDHGGVRQGARPPDWLAEVDAIAVVPD